MFGKLKNYMALGPNYKLPNNYMAFCPSYILPKVKSKDKAQIYLTKDLNPEARLRNWKVLGTYSAQTESGFLDSCDQFMHVMNNMLNMLNKG